MSANVEWDVAQTLTSPYATLDLNTVLPLAGRDNAAFFMVKPDGYQIVPAKLRPVSDSISQADGSSLQPPYIDGLVLTMTVAYYIAVRGDAGETDPACAEDLRLMNQTLMGILNSLRVYSANPNSDQRYLWTPTGLGDRRMLTDILLASWPTVAYDGKEVSVTFQLATPFPYAIDATEIDTVIADGDSEIIQNNGNAGQSMVARVAGPSTGFVIENLDTGQLVSYDGSRPGAANIPTGHFAELDFFRGTIFMDGDAADLIAGLDPAQTDFFLLEPGSQQIASTGGVTTVLSNNAWV